MAGCPGKSICNGIQLVRLDAYALRGRGNGSPASSRPGFFHDTHGFGTGCRTERLHSVDRNGTIGTNMPAQIDQLRTRRAWAAQRCLAVRAEDELRVHRALAPWAQR